MAEVFAWSFLAGNPDVRSGTVTLLDNTSSTVVIPNQEAHRLNAGFVLAILEAGEKLKITWDSGGASSGGDSDYAIKIMVVRL